MGSKTNYLQSAVLNAVLRNTPYTSPATVYVGLFTVAPTDAYTSEVPTGTEISGNDYVRKSIIFGLPIGDPEVTSNTEVIFFPVSAGSWGTAVAFGVFDAESGGNLLYWHALSSSLNIDIGRQVTFQIGTLTITEN